MSPNCCANVLLCHTKSCTTPRRTVSRPRPTSTYSKSHAKRWINFLASL